MRILILGAAAGGGLPQWNCGCSNCAAARSGRIPALTQSSIAVSADGSHWAVINASPDIRSQLGGAEALYPIAARQVPMEAVLVTNGDIDHVAGLLTLREKQPFTLFGTREILAVLAANPVFDALDRDLVRRSAVALDQPFSLAEGLTATVFAVPGKVPLYLEGADVQVDLEGEQTVGVELCDGRRRAYYIPGCARLTPGLRERLAGAELLLFDGTLWTDDEMIRLGLGQKTGRRMGHMPVSGADGSLAAFATAEIGRKVYVHINNSNPLVDPASAEAKAAEAAGWIVGRDGMELCL